LKDDGNGAPSRAHPDSKSIVITHIGLNVDIISVIFRLAWKSALAVWRRVLSSSCTRRTADRGDFGKVEAALETLRQSGQECATRAELWSKDAKPLAGATLIDLVEQIDDVEPELHSLQDTGIDRLDDAEVHLLVAGQAGAIWNGAVRSEAAPGSQVDGEPGVGRRQLVFDTG
jgi:hypothetical protein